ncbi:MAG: murein biosynthesis integral membrane protein MurJ [Caulobacterales bacterium]
MSLLRNTLVQTTLTAFSRLLGFARDVAISAVMGVGPISDAFVAAQRFPNLFRRLFAEGAFSQAFVPLYAKATASGDSKEADRLASEALSFILAVTVVLTVLAEVCMPWIMAVIFTGYRDQPETFRMAVLLTQITMPYLVCMTLAALFSGVLNAVGRFALAAFAPTLLNLCLLVTLWPLYHVDTARIVIAALEFILQRKVHWPLMDSHVAAFAGATAISVAGVLQAGLLWYGARRAGLHLRFTPPRLTPDVKKIVALAIPGAIAGGATQINIMISQTLSSLEVGASTYLYNADRLYQLPLGLVGVAVGLALLPRLARAVRADDAYAGKNAMDEAITLSMALTLPAAMALIIIPYLLIYGFFVRGHFTHENAQMTAAALRQFAWGVPAFVLAKVLAPAFFAREDMRRPMNYALISVGVNAVLGAALFFTFQAMGKPGFVGLAIATSIAAWINVFLLYRRLKQTGVWSVSAQLRDRLTRVVLAVVVTGAIVAALAIQREFLIKVLLSSKVLVAIFVPAAGAALYALLALAFKAVTLSELKASLRRERGGESLPNDPVA